MSTYGVIPHRLIPGATVSCCDAPLNLSVSIAEGYGFGTASWDEYSVPAAVGTAVEVTLEGGCVFQGKVASASPAEMVAERLLYHVEAQGNAEDLKANECVEGVFVDRDIAQWKSATSGYNTAPDFAISVDISDKITFTWPQCEEVLVDVALPATSYWEHFSNTPPAHDVSDFGPAKSLWSAAVYHIGGGATAKKVSSVRFSATWNLAQPYIDTIIETDYDNPIGPPDEKYGHRHSEYESFNMWSGLYSLYKAPDNCFAALYACDDLADLPTADPLAMYYAPERLQRFAHVDQSGGSVRTGFETSCKYLVFYVAYLPVFEPMNTTTEYDEGFDHLVRFGWQAATRMYAEPGQFLTIYDIEVCSQGYHPGEDGSDDLRRIISILYPESVVPPMKLAAASDGDAPRSIAFRNPTTMLAAISELIAMHPDEWSWGVWESHELRIAKPADCAGFAVADEPGVDTSGCNVTSDGAVDLMLVAYSAPAAMTATNELTLPAVLLLTVDAGGEWSAVEPGWQPDEGVRCGFLDATANCNSPSAAAAAGQSVAVERRPDQACGSVTLHAITGAALVRTGGLLSGPGVPADARITSVSISVDADSVTLSLGPSGFLGRFPPRMAGKPMTAASSGSKNWSVTSTLETRRLLR